MSIEKEIKQRLQKNLELHHFELKDFTGRHLNHKLHEGGFHLEAVIVSKNFDGLSLIDRHKMVYSALNDLIKTKIHAISIKAKASDE